MRAECSSPCDACSISSSSACSKPSASPPPPSRTARSAGSSSSYNTSPPMSPASASAARSSARTRSSSSLMRSGWFAIASAFVALRRSLPATLRRYPHSSEQLEPVHAHKQDEQEQRHDLKGNSQWRPEGLLEQPADAVARHGRHTHVDRVRHEPADEEGGGERHKRRGHKPGGHEELRRGHGGEGEQAEHYEGASAVCTQRVADGIQPLETRSAQAPPEVAADRG